MKKSGERAEMDAIALVAEGLNSHKIELEEDSEQLAKYVTGLIGLAESLLQVHCGTTGDDPMEVLGGIYQMMVARIGNMN